MSFSSCILKKMQKLVRNHNFLYSYNNGANNLKSLYTCWTDLKPNLNKIYYITTSILKLILFKISRQKLAGLLRL